MFIGQPHVFWSLALLGAESDDAVNDAETDQTDIFLFVVNLHDKYAPRKRGRDVLVDR